MLADKVKKYIQAQQLVKPGDRVIIGVSGGPDSVALLHIMHSLAPQLNCELIAAHLNHELRAEAAAEEAFVKQLCRNMGIKCYSRTVPVAKIAREQKAGVEAIGRRVRYDFFSELLQELGAQRIATAHHQDDVAETVLMNLLRGSGIKGLRGILPVRGVTIRPLLNVSKQELLEYLDSYSITYCTDESNADQYYMRNRIRHSLIPFLEQEFNPRIVDKLNQLAMIAQEEYSALEQESRRLWAELLLREDEGIVVLDNRILLRLPRAYQRRIVLQAFTALAGAAEWGMDDVEKVLGLSSQVNSGSALTLHLKKKVLVNKSYDKMIFTTRVIEKTEFSYRLSIPGRVDITEIGCSYFITRVGIEDFTPAEGDVYFDYDLLPDNLYLRSRRPGDYYRPPGMQGRKKLKKMFIDLKIPYAKRDQVVLLAGGESEIYAVLGLGISRKAALNPQTKVVLLIRSQRG